MIELISAASPRFVTPGRDVIVLDVQFAHLATPVEFAATPTDPELHGRDIHARAIAGEFGAVTEYAPPEPAEIAAHNNPAQRASAMTQAIESATHWDMMGDVEQAAAWRGYYRELHAMTEHPEWPVSAPWPQPPT